MRTPARILTLALVLVVLLAAGGEFAARWYVNHEAEQRVPASVENPRLSFPIPSLLIDAADKTISHLTFSAQGEVPIEADIKDLDISDTKTPVAGQIEATVHLSDAYLLAVIQQRQESMGLDGFLGDLTRVTSYTSSASTGTSTVGFAGSSASLEIRPSASGGEFQVDATNLTVGGFDLGSEVGNLITSAITSKLKENLQDFTVESVTVEDGATIVRVNGQGILLSQELAVDALRAPH